MRQPALLSGSHVSKAGLIPSTVDAVKDILWAEAGRCRGRVRRVFVGMSVTAGGPAARGFLNLQRKGRKASSSKREGRQGPERAAEDQPFRPAAVRAEV